MESSSLLMEVEELVTVHNQIITVFDCWDLVNLLGLGNKTSLKEFKRDLS